MPKSIEGYKISAECVDCGVKMKPIEDKNGDYHECPECGAKTRPKLENVWVGETV